MMIDKRELLLDQIIKEYLNTPEPIGSEYLKLKLSIKISSATIRNYFKILSDEGKLEQLHISSGRVPTDSALKLFWKQNLSPLEKIGLPKDSEPRIKEGARKNRLFCVVKFYKPNCLREVVNVKNKYLLAGFDNGEVAMPYHASLERFLKELIDMEINDLIRVADEVCAHSLRDRLRALNTEERGTIKEGSSELISMASIDKPISEHFEEYLSGTIMDKVGEGIYFSQIVPTGFMAIKQDISIDEKDAKMMVIGRLFRNYSKFYSFIKEI